MLKFAKKDRKEREELQVKKGLREAEVKEALKDPEGKEEKEIKEQKEGKDDAEDGVDAEDAKSSDSSKNSDSPKNSDESENSDESDSYQNSDDSENPENSDDSECSENSVEAPAEAERRNYSEVEEAYCLGAGIDTATLSEAKALLYEVADAVKSGRFVPELLRKAICLLNYDRDVEKARREGIEEGRLEKLKEALDAKNSAAKEADAIPHLGGSKSLGNAAQSDSIFNLARDAK